ncbi:Mitochondrial distribution and morphology protein 12 [Spiromyces aspiralis]|uniref:Mitochondrial distribution and morphology protein 12 n=1 Tax=Spiromyces aspiralis TaxID=68401 RepID=A0ACC1HWR7_9FUNG|nr:Mitochondrial distribution and morphology protein 12 [Spiromyces aspiralis]
MVNGAPFGESHSIRICEICYVNYMASDDMVLSGDHPTPTPRTDELLWQRQQYKSSHHRHSRSAISVTNLTTHYSHPQPSLDLKRLKSPDSAKSLGALHSNVTASAVSATKLHTHEKSPLTKYPSITPGGPTYAFHATARRIAYQDDHDNCAFLGTQFGPQHEGQGRAMLGSDIARSRLPCYGEPGTFDSSRAASLPPYPDELRGSTQPFSCRAELLAKKEACDGMNAEARQRLSVDIKHPALDGFSLEQLRRLTRQLLSEAGVPEKRGWDSILFRMATLAAHLVRPNIQANDNIDLRQYVRIKRIPGGSPSDSQYISGVVFTKAFVYRQMLQAQRDPSIMIITFPLTYEQPENRFISFDAAAPQEEEYMTKLVDRIIRYRPTVIFAEKTVSRSALRRLADNGISVAFNIKRNVLRAISRCTGASIITSVDKFALGPKLGYCGAVWSEFVEDPSLPKIAKPFIFIDGCQPEYGATLVLRGESFDRLEAIKNAADLLVSFAYSLRLETSLLLCEYALTVLPRPPAATDRGATQAAPLPATDTPAARALCKYQVLLSSSPSVHVPPPYVLVQMKIHEDAIRDINARYQKNPSFKKGNLASLTTNPATTLHKSGVDFLLSRQSKEAMEFRTSFAYEIELSVHMPYIQEGEAFLHANPGPVNPLDHQNLALSYIVTCGENDNEVCVPPQIYVIDFYGDTDITLGQYLEKLCFDLDYDCPGKDPCDYPMYQHCRSYVHCTGRLDVTMEEYPCPIPTMSEVLLMWGVCSKCGISTPITPMLDDASRYSFGKYLELLFYGTPSSPRASLCKHDIHHDYVRWFALHNMAVKFMFREIRPLDVKTPTMLIYQNFDIQARLKKKEAAELREKLRRYYESVITRLRTFPMDYVDVANKEDCKQDLDDMVARANTELEYINQLLDQTMQSSHYADVLALFVVYEQMQSKVLEWSLKFTRLIEKFIGFELDNRLNGPAGGNLSAATSAIGKLSRVVSLDNLSMSEKQQIPAGGQHKDFINNLNVDMGTDQMGSLSGQTTQFATQTPCMPLLGHSPSSSEVHLPLPEVDPAANPETRKANIFRRLSLRLLREERERSEKHSAVVAPAAAAPTSAAAAAAAATSAATPTTEEKHTRKSTRTGGEYEAGTGPGHLIHPNPPPVYPETGLHARPQAIGKSRVPTIYHKKQKATTATAPAMTPLSRDGSGGLTGHRMLSVSSIDSASSAGHEKPQRVPATKIPTYRATTQKGPARRSIAGPPDGGISGSRGLELFESRIPRLAGPPQRGAHGSHKDLDRNLDSSTLMRITRRLSGLDEDSSRKTLPLGDVSRKMSFWIPAAAQYISRHPKRPSLSQVNLFQTRVGSNNKQSSNQSLKPPGPHSLGSAQQQGRADKTTVGRASHQQRQYMSLPSSRNYKLSSHIQAPQSQRSKDQSDRRSTSSRAARASLASSSQRKPSFGSELRNTTRPHLGLGLNWARSIGRSKSQSQPTSSQPRQAPSHRRARDRGAEDDDDDDDDEYDYEYYYDNDKEGAENYPASRSKWKAATMAPSIDSSVGDLQDNNVASGMDSISIDTDDEEGEGLSSSSSSSSDNDSSSHLSSFDWSIFDIDKDAPLSMVAEEKGEGEVKKETEGKKVHDEDTAAHDRGNNHESGGHGPAYDHYREYSVSELSPRLEIANMQAESSPSRRYRRRNTLSGDGVSDGDDDEAHDEDDSPLSPDLHFDDGAGGSDIEDTAPTIEMTDETGKVVTEGRHPDSGSAAPARRRSEERASMGLRNEKAVSPMAVPKRRALDEGSIQRFSKPTSPREAAGARAGLTDQTQADNVRTVWKTLSEMFQSPASKQLLQISQDIDYPFLSTDHVIARSPIIVRETELSSIVGFTLTAPEYTAALNGLIQKSMVNFEGPGAVPLSDEQRRELELENTLCNMPIGHLRFKFNGGETSFSCRVFFPAQFDALRRCCGCNSNFVDSMSRCFVEMPRTRIEGFLASFPRLMVAGQQHTTVETESIRYVYQPLGEDMYTVLITNRNSNIVQDIDTLNLVVRAVNDICEIMDQDDIIGCAFELITAFDEIITLGYRENIDLPKLRTIMEMESHEEKIQEIIQKNKEREAKQELKRKAKMFEEQRREAARRGLSTQDFGGLSSNIGGMSGASSRLGSGYDMVPASEPAPTFTKYTSTPAVPKSDASSKIRGMKLSKKTKAPSLLSSTLAPPEEVESLMNDLSINEEEPPAPEQSRKDIHISIEEHVSATINRDGGLEEMEVKGDMFLTTSSEECSKAQLQLTLPENIKPQYKTHPNIDKKAFTQDSALRLKERARSFPPNQPAGVLKWRFVSQDEEDVLLNINCWPEQSSDGRFTVNVEYEKAEKNAGHIELKDVVISIPLQRGAQPEIGDIAEGSYEVRPGALLWKVPIIDNGNSTGSMEFTTAAASEDNFFPVSVSFKGETPFCNININEVTVPGLDEVVYSKVISLSTEHYQVV